MGLAGKRSVGSRTRAAAVISGLVAFGVFQTMQPAFAASAGNAVAQAMTNTYAQPFVQVKAKDVIFDKGVGDDGKPFHSNGKYAYNAKFELDNGAYDEFLNYQGDDVFGKQTANYFITNDKTVYVQEGKKWVKNGPIVTTTLDEEQVLLKHAVDVKAKTTAGHQVYVAALDGSEIADLLNNYFMQGSNAFGSMASDLQTRSKDVLTITTTTINGKSVISQLQLRLNVTLTEKESIAIDGATSNQSKVKPFHYSLQTVYKNAFAADAFPSPLTGKTPSN